MGGRGDEAAGRGGGRDEEVGGTRSTAGRGGRDEDVGGTSRLAVVGGFFVV